MAYAIMFGNSKGGVGKTTTAVNVADLLAAKKYRVLLVDMDPQGHCAMALGKEPLQFYNTVAEVLTGEADIGEAVVKMNGGFDLLPSNINLFDIEDEIKRNINAYFLLHKRLTVLQSKYDYIIIDSPPNIGAFVLNAILASNLVIVPVDSSYLGVEGCLRIQKIITEHVNKNVNTPVLMKILITMFDVRTRMSRDIKEDIERLVGKDILLDSFINRNTDIEKSIASGKTIRHYAKENKKDPRGLTDYQSLVDELIALTTTR